MDFSRVPAARRPTSMSRTSPVWIELLTLPIDFKVEGTQLFPQLRHWTLEERVERGLAGQAVTGREQLDHVRTVGRCLAGR
jgi:hypothetical protein